jgi:ABC-type transporter Mla maintaining outer membrane lipid asymmetry ATPase subunit MlaF/ABC-type transporter Mla maintaining outer membrane lipid asymmetry permease subunit MlaE
MNQSSGDKPQHDQEDPGNSEDHNEPNAGMPVRVKNVTLTAGNRVLLDRVEAAFEPSQVALIIGPSGTGKSLLLRSIAGLLDRSHAAIKLSGSIHVGDHDILQSPGSASVGVVFQHFALFDELSPTQNVRFAHAHQTKSRGDNKSDGKEHAHTDEPDALLDELNVPRNIHTSQLSGGQQQRLAIARTLTYNPDVILYDEPTSGLDAATSEQVANLIKHTHTSHPKTAIIVTHDYESLAPIADVVYLLDAESRTLKKIAREEWPTLRDKLMPVHFNDYDQDGVLSASAANTSITAESFESSGRLQSNSNLIRTKLGAVAKHVKPIVMELLETTGRVVEAAAMAPLRLLPRWESPAWGMRYFLHYLRLVAGPSAWVYLALTGLIIGFVTTHFTFQYLPYAGYTEPLIKEEVLGSVGYALFRILIPMLATILIAARCGAAVASDVGNKTYGKQIDALRSFGAKPDVYLLTNILYAFLIGTPILVLVSFYIAKLTSMVAFAAAFPELGPMFWDQYFHVNLIIPGQTFYDGVGWMLAKVVCCGVGVALISYYQGARPKSSSNAVSKSITGAILWSTLYVLMVHFVFAFYEFQPVE